MNDPLTIIGTPPLADYLLEKNPATGTALKVYVEGEKLKMMEARRRSELRRAGQPPVTSDLPGLLILTLLRGASRRLLERGPPSAVVRC